MMKFVLLGFHSRIYEPDMSDFRIFTSRMSYFKSYGPLYQHIYEHFRHSSLYQNRPIRANFIYNYSLPASKLAFISNFSHFLSLYVVEFNSRVSK